MELDQFEVNEFEFDWSVYELFEDPRPDYSNSSQLDVHLYSEKSNVEDAAKVLCDEIGYSKNRAVTHMKVVLLNLYWANLLSSERWIGYSRDNNRYGIPFRYNKQRIEVHPLCKVVDGLLERGYIDNKEGYFNYKRKEGKNSKMKATEKLLELLEEKHNFTIDDVGRHPDEEVIVKRDVEVDGQKKYLDYEDDRESERMRRFLNQYNEFIQKTYIDLDYMGYEHSKKLSSNAKEYLLKLPTHMHFDLTKRKMRRVFNNNSFKLGGRFYGGFWTEMPSELRKRLIINSQKVIECDFSGVHINLLYNKIGIDYGRYNKDPYELPDYPATPEYRCLFKQLLLAAINAETDKLAKSALQEKINFNRSDYPDDIPDLDEIINDFREYHEPISNKLFSGVGLELMYQDSKIAEHVMSIMYNHRIPVLPVHDSFICPKLHVDKLYEAMLTSYRIVTNTRTTNYKYLINIKETELDRQTEDYKDELYFDFSNSEDLQLAEHLIDVDEFELKQPHRLYVNVKIKYI